MSPTTTSPTTSSGSSPAPSPSSEPSKCFDAAKAGGAARAMAPRAAFTAAMRDGLRADPGRGSITPYERALVALLDALGWEGDADRLLDALPHGAPLRAGSDLAETLSGLGYAAAPRRLSLRRCDARCFPLAFHHKGGLWVALARRADGRLEAQPADWEAGPQPMAPPRGRVDALLIARPGRAAEPRSASDGSPRSAFTHEGWDDASGEGAPGPRWLGDQLAARRDAVLAAFALTGAINLFAIATPLYSMAVYNMIVPSQAVDTLIFATAIVLLALVAEDRLRRLRGRLTADAAASLYGRLTRAAFGKVLRLPLARLEAAAEHEQAAQIRRPESGPALFQGPAAMALFDAPFIVLFLAVMAALGGVLALIPLALALILGVFAWLLGPFARRAEARAAEARRAARALLTETTAAASAIRAAAAERIWIDRVRRALDREAAAAARSEALQQSAGHVAQFFTGLAAVAMLSVGAAMAIAGTLSIGALIAVIMLMWKALSPLHILFASLASLQGAREDAAAVATLMRLPEEGDAASASGAAGAPTGPAAGAAARGTRTPRRFRGAIAFDAVSHRYADAAGFSLRGVSFDLAPGERLGVMGAAGAGRTTLLRLALGLRTPTLGEITIDGLPATQFDAVAFRAQCAYVAQEPPLLYGTVAQNLRLVRQDLSDAEMALMLEALELPCDPRRFPEGLKTRLTAARRATLGVEALQVLALARALLSERPLLVLDDPTATLGEAAAAAFAAQLSARRGRDTALVATNHQAVLGACDKILVLARGRPAAYGAPETVLKALS